jgi:transposase
MFDIALDLHKENTYGVVLDDISGQTVWEGNFASNPKAAKEALELYFVKGTKVAIEATSCFYPMYDYLNKIKGINVCIVNTTKLEKPAVKTDKIDAHRIAHLLRRNELPTAFIPDKELRSLRELCSLRVRLVQSCTQCKNRIHAILHKEGKAPFGVKDIFSKKGRAQLEKIKNGIVRKEEFEEEFDLLKIHEKKLKRIEKQIHQVIQKDKKLKKNIALIDSLPGFAQTLAFVCATEIGPILRFDSGQALVAYAGMYPCINSSGGKIRHGKIRRVGRKLFRWALIEAAHIAGRTKSPIGNYYRKKAKQKKSNHAAAVATANKLARLMYEVLSKQKPYDPKAL